MKDWSHYHLRSQQVGEGFAYFCYPRSRIALYAIVYCVILGFPAVVALLEMAIYPQARGFWIATKQFAHPLGLGWFWAIMVAASAYNFLLHRPVSISPIEISSWMLGRRWKSLYWKDVKHVTRVQSFEYELGGKIETVKFKSEKSKISVRSYIGNYGDFKQRVNDALKRKNIEVIQVDVSGLKKIKKSIRPGHL